MQASTANPWSAASYSGKDGRYPFRHDVRQSSRHTLRPVLIRFLLCTAHLSLVVRPGVHPATALGWFTDSLVFATIIPSPGE